MSRTSSAQNILLPNQRLPSQLQASQQMSRSPVRLASGPGRELTSPRDVMVSCSWQLPVSSTRDVVLLPSGSRRELTPPTPGRDDVQAEIMALQSFARQEEQKAAYCRTEFEAAEHNWQGAEFIAAERAEMASRTTKWCHKELEAACEQAQLDAEAAREAIGMSETEVAILQQNHKYQTEVAILQQNVEEKNRLLADNTEAFTSLRQELERAKDQDAKLVALQDKSIAMPLKEIERLKGELSTSEEVARLAFLRAQGDRAHSEKLQQEVDELRAALYRSETEIQNTKELCEQERNKVRLVSTTRASAEQGIIVLTAKYQEALARNEALEDRLEQLKKQVAKQDTKDVLSAKYQGVVIENEALRGRVQQLTRQVAEAEAREAVAVVTFNALAANLGTGVQEYQRPPGSRFIDKKQSEHEGKKSILQIGGKKINDKRKSATVVETASQEVKRVERVLDRVKGAGADAQEQTLKLRGGLEDSAANNLEVFLANRAAAAEAEVTQLKRRIVELSKKPSKAVEPYKAGPAVDADVAKVQVARLSARLAIADVHTKKLCEQLDKKSSALQQSNQASLTAQLVMADSCIITLAHRNKDLEQQIKDAQETVQEKVRRFEDRVRNVVEDERLHL